MRRRAAEQDAGLRAGEDVSPRSRRPWGHRPGPLRGSAAVAGWTRDRRTARNRRDQGREPCQVPGRTVPSPKIPRWRAGRRRAIASSPWRRSDREPTIPPRRSARHRPSLGEGDFSQTSGAPRRGIARAWLFEICIGRYRAISSRSSCPALCRASTSLKLPASKTWMAGTSPAKTHR
jgi:hypothetical protein